MKLKLHIMKANIFLKDFNCNDCVKSIVKKLSDISGLSGVEVDQNLAKISFRYDSDDAAFMVFERLKSLGYSV